MLLLLLACHTDAPSPAKDAEDTSPAGTDTEGTDTADSVPEDSGDTGSEDSGDTGSEDSGDTAPTDQDGDGSPAGEDCDDADPAVHPGATEVCDGLDNDCDATTPEDGLAGYVTTEGYTDVTAAYAGAPGAPVTNSPSVDGELHLCAGTWYTGIVPRTANLAVVGHGGRDAVRLDGAGATRLFDAATAGTSLRLEGLTLQNGSTISGGAIYAEGVTLSLREVTLTGNAASDRGGALFAAGATVTLEEVSVEDNQSTNAGGGLYLSGSTLELRDTTFTANVAGSDGGGAWLGDSAVTGAGLVWTGNTAGQNGGGLALSGGELDLEEVTWTGNEAAFRGGALAVAEAARVDVTDGTAEENRGYEPSAVYLTDGSELTWTGGQVRANEGGQPAAMLNEQSTLTLTGVDVSENRRSGMSDGGGIKALEWGTVTLDSTRVWGHTGFGVELAVGASLSCVADPEEHAGLYANDVAVSIDDPSSSMDSTSCDFGEEGADDDNVRVDVFNLYGEYVAGDDATFACASMSPCG